MDQGLLQLILILSLLGIIVILFFERSSLLDQAQKEKDRLLDEISKLTKALISKNANDYVMTTSIDKVTKDEKTEPVEEDQEISIDALSDDEFDEALGIKRKAPKK